jgi:hypothetical protein
LKDLEIDDNIDEVYKDLVEMFGYKIKKSLFSKKLVLKSEIFEGRMISNKNIFNEIEKTFNTYNSYKSNLKNLNGGIFFPIKQ